MPPVLYTQKENLIEVKTPFFICLKLQYSDIDIKSKIFKVLCWYFIEIRLKVISFKEWWEIYVIIQLFFVTLSIFNVQMVLNIEQTI